MSNESITDFADGQRDCQKGLPEDTERNEAYQQGYEFEYAMTEINSKQAELSWG